MADITIAGAGHGGVIAAMLLAKAGHNVTVYEKNGKGEVGLEQKDSLDETALEYAGVEVPEKFRAPGNVITFIPLEDDVAPVTLPSSPGYKNMTVDRREFISYLISLAEAEGAKFVYNSLIEGPVLLGSRVAGIIVNGEKIYSDLVIDSAGIHSPVRMGLPIYMHVDRQPAYYDCLHTYRAYFDRVPGVPDPETTYNIYVKEDGTNGFRWAITEKDKVDVLLARFPQIDYSDVAQGLYAVSEYNPHMDRNLLRGGHFADIPIRQPLAVMVADGYAAVGDSAFMTDPLKGSGMAYSIKAGKMLADCIAEDDDCKFNTDYLWEYQKRFYKEIGFNACRLAVFKSVLPYMTAEEVNEMFKRGITSSDELLRLASGEIPKSKLLGLAREKLRLMDDVPQFKAHLSSIIKRLGRFTSIEPTMPSKYSEDSIEKWALKYNKFYDSIRKQEDLDE